MVAAGTENGNKRDTVLASIQTSFADLHGISRQNTRVNWPLERVQSTTGTATQPQEEGDLYYGAELASPPASTPAESGSATPALAEGAAGGAAVAGASAVHANTSAQTPAKPLDDGSSALPPSNTQPREGTSATKLEQQEVLYHSRLPLHYFSAAKKLTIHCTAVYSRRRHKRRRHTPRNSIRRRRQSANLRTRNRRPSPKGRFCEPPPR
jgi:hypothetical protein